MNKESLLLKSTKWRIFPDRTFHPGERTFTAPAFHSRGTHAAPLLRKKTVTHRRRTSSPPPSRQLPPPPGVRASIRRHAGSAVEEPGSTNGPSLLLLFAALAPPGRQRARPHLLHPPPHREHRRASCPAVPHDIASSSPPQPPPRARASLPSPAACISSFPLSLHLLLSTVHRIRHPGPLRRRHRSPILSSAAVLGLPTPGIRRSPELPPSPTPAPRGSNIGRSPTLLCRQSPPTTADR
jgi:hypothetical protein